jgi:hypothetical protein
MSAMSDDGLLSPPREFSLFPFWFWNDELSEREILRQIADFDAHGVYGFVIHPRVGLPRTIGWMSDAMLGFMSIAVREARRRDMKVILYDEGMYPSGSSSGQVVATNANLACRCLAMQELGTNDAPKLAAGQNLVAQVTTASGKRVAIVDRKADSYIRGLHYVGEGPREDEPPAGDILNPETAHLILKLVYDRCHGALGEYFGNAIIAFFTDEPNPLGKCRERNVRPGTMGILEYANRMLGYDFTPHLPALWLDDEPDARRYRRDYDWVIHRLLEESWYRPLSDWCEAHRVALCGHPDRGDELGVQRFFHFPGQDLVWRFVEPDKPTALEGPESTQAKVTSSAMIHLGRRRNGNEFCGAYGHQTTFAEMRWLADWCMVRGVNLLVPHAFYYSIRGPRKDERPPQLGPWTPAWDDGRFHAFADHCRRLCWLNTDAQHVCDIAILTDSDHCAWRAAKTCLEHQRDFNYLDPETLLTKAEVKADGVRAGPMRYQLIVIDGLDPIPPQVTERLRPMTEAGHVLVHQPDGAEKLLAAIDRTCAADVQLTPPSTAVRFRHVVKGGRHFYILFNEVGRPVKSTLTAVPAGARSWIDTTTGRATPIADGDALQLSLDAYGVALLQVVPK